MLRILSRDAPTSFSLSATSTSPTCRSAAPLTTPPSSLPPARAMLKTPPLLFCSPQPLPWLLSSLSATALFSSPRSHPTPTHRRACTSPASLRASLRRQFLQAVHDAPLGGHPGRDRTLELASRSLFWPNLARDVKLFVKRCDSCQRAKPANTDLSAPLQPLPPPSQRWEHVSVDFMGGLPPAGPLLADTVMTVVDRLTKRVHFIATHHTADAPATAQLFLDHVVRLHGLPKSILSDRDTRFTSLFWQSLATTLNIKLSMSTANHPQTDGQTERYHRSLQETLRHFVGHLQADWINRLAAAEFAVNNALNASTGTTPFFLDLGYHPGTGLPTALVSAPRDAPPLPQELTAFLETQRTTAQLAQDAILGAQLTSVVRDSQSRSRPPHPFAVGDLVLVSSEALLSPAQRDRPSRKLSFPWQGPFKVLAVPSPAVVRLSFPRSIRAHPVVNVTFLKLYTADPDLPAPPPPVLGQDDEPEWAVEAVLSHRCRRSRWTFLVKWEGLGVASNEWLSLDALVDRDEMCINESLLRYAQDHPEVQQSLPDWDWALPPSP